MAEKEEKRDAGFVRLRRAAVVVLAMILIVSLGTAAYFRLTQSQSGEMMPPDEWYGEIYAYRTESASDEGKLRGVLERLPVPAKMNATGDIELTDDEERGKRLRVYYTCLGSSADLLDVLDNRGRLDICGAAVFSLVGDLDHVSFVIAGKDDETVIPYGREGVNTNADEDVFAGTTSPEQLRIYCRRILDIHNASYNH